MKKNSTYSVFRKLLFVVLLFMTGITCAPVISKQMREQVNPKLTFREVMSNPELYKGQTIILSGIIVKAKNTKEGTLFEVLQTPSDSRGKPEDVDESQGRFLALGDPYLDTSVYTEGQAVTIAGTIEGKRIQTLGDLEYTYPLIRIKELYLWPIEIYPYPYPYPYSYYGFDRYYWGRNSLLYHRHFPRDRHDSDRQKDGKSKIDRGTGTGKRIN